MLDVVEVQRGEAPLVLSFPHTGTELAEIGVVSRALALYDTDWLVHQLYDFAHELGATTVRTRFSRTVADVNRDPSGRSLYPGQITTALCPTETFDGEALYAEGDAPDVGEVERRRARFFDPYHEALEAELERLGGRGKSVVLYDCHSIRSVVPRLFAGELPALNLGTVGGASCAPELEAVLVRALGTSEFSHTTNGRFRGGWITRHHGAPERGIHAVQMEIAQRAYMSEPALGDVPQALVSEQAEPLRRVLRHLLACCIEFAEGEAL